MAHVYPSMLHIYKKASSGLGFEYVVGIDDYVSYIITDRWQESSEIEIVYAPSKDHILNRFVNQTLDNENTTFFVYISELQMMFMMYSFDFKETYSEGVEVVLYGMDILSWIAQGYKFTVKEKEYKYNNRTFLTNLSSSLSVLNDTSISVTNSISETNTYKWTSDRPLYTSETISSTIDGGSTLFDVITNYFIQFGVGFSTKYVTQNTTSSMKIDKVCQTYKLPVDLTRKIFSISDGSLSSIRFYKDISTLVNHVTECGTSFDKSIRYTTDQTTSYNNRYMKRMHYVSSNVSINTLKQLYGANNANINNATWVNNKIDQLMHADAKKFLDEPKTLMECVYNAVDFTDVPNVGEVYSISASIFDTAADMIVMEKIISKSGSEESIVLTLQDTKEVFPWL